MKKAVAGLFSLVLLFGIMVGSASAETPLSASVNSLMGSPYKYGGTTTKGFDCSGFTSYVFDGFGIDLTRSSKTQAQEGSWVDKSDLRPGDLVFFNTDGRSISHVGIYVGAGKFAHSATNQGVTINALNDSYYSKRYVTARRVLDDATYEQLMTDN